VAAAAYAPWAATLGGQPTISTTSAPSASKDKGAGAAKTPSGLYPVDYRMQNNWVRGGMQELLKEKVWKVSVERLDDGRHAIKSTVAETWTSLFRWRTTPLTGGPLCLAAPPTA